MCAYLQKPASHEARQNRVSRALENGFVRHPVRLKRLLMRALRFKLFTLGVICSATIAVTGVFKLVVIPKGFLPAGKDTGLITGITAGCGRRFA